MAQAELEALDVFPWLVPPQSVASGSQMNLLGGDDPSNGFLLALSCGLSRLAFDASEHKPPVFYDPARTTKAYCRHHAVPREAPELVVAGVAHVLRHSARE